MDLFMNAGAATGTPHQRSFSYDQMQQMGLSKAIDEYHRLLQTSPPISSPKKSTPSVASPFGVLLKTTLIRPLPRILRPEAFITLVAALWRVLTYLVYISAPLTVPLLIWLALAPAAPLRLPAQLTGAFPVLSTIPLQPPADWRIRLVLAAGFFLFLRVAESSVTNRARCRQEAAAHAVTAQQLEAYYAGSQLAGAVLSGASTPQGADVASVEDWQKVVNGVRALSKQYEDVPASVDTVTDAISWLERVSREVNMTLSKEVHDCADAAMKALEEVKEVLVA